MKKNDIKNNRESLNSLLEGCCLCPRNCGVDRTKGEKGFCKAAFFSAVYSSGLHHGEEPPISGTRGSGTIFFTHCNMACVYCQNFKFSQLSDEKEMTSLELAGIMLRLEKEGCHNINLVSPTHFIPQIVDAVFLARKKGLSVPIVYNTGGYDALRAIKLLDGIVDIYMPDMRYSDDFMARKYSNAPGYVENNRAIVKEMYRQVGGLRVDGNGVAKRGLIIRCLVLPNGISGTGETLKYISQNISKDISVSLMSQYYPIYKTGEYTELKRRVTASEYDEALKALEKYGLNKGWAQGSPENMDDSFGGHMITPREMRLK